MSAVKNQRTVRKTVTKGSRWESAKGRNLAENRLPPKHNGLGYNVGDNMYSAFWCVYIVLRRFMATTEKLDIVT